MAEKAKGSYTARDQLSQINYNSNTVAQFGYDVGGRRTSRTIPDSYSTQTTWTYASGDNVVSGVSDSQGWN